MELLKGLWSDGKVKAAVWGLVGALLAHFGLLSVIGL